MNTKRFPVNRWCIWLAFTACCGYSPVILEFQNTLLQKPWKLT
jgi:hypothetical protein